MAYTRACKSYEPYRPSACTHTHSSSSTFAIASFTSFQREELQKKMRESSQAK